jgi:hypothetical protein
MTGDVSRGGAERPVSGYETWLRRRRRREIPVFLGLLVFGGFLLTGWRTHIGLAVLGVWIGGVGLLALAARHLRDRGRAGRGPHGEIVSASLDGVPATALKEHPAPARLTAVFVAYPGFLLLSPLLGWTYLEVSLRCVLVALALPFLLWSRWYVRCARRAGVWLTETEIVVQGWGHVARTHWVDVVRVQALDLPRTPCVEITARHPLAVLATGRSRMPDLDWPGRIQIVTLYLPFDTDVTERVLRSLADGTQTSLLGTAAGPDLVRAIADGAG